MRFSKSLIATMCLLASEVQAGSLGTVGPVYKIQEQDMLQWLERRVKAQVDSGEYQKQRDLEIAKAKEKLLNPAPIEGVSRAKSNRTFFYDPSFTVQENVTDQYGAILVPAGTTINPLEKVSMTQTLIFFDARDKNQVVFAKKYIATQKNAVKPILTGGSYMELMKTWQSVVYYDQLGTLVKKFSILNVPAVVRQDGYRLRIDEIAL